MRFNSHILSLFENFRGTKILSTYKHLLQTQKFNAQQLEEYQFTKFVKLLDHCRQFVPFYVEYFRSNNLHISDFKSLKDITMLPIMSKENMREMFYNNKIISTNNSLFKPITNQTGGSTGIPLKLLLGKQARDLQGGAVLRYYNWMGKNFFNDKMAVLWGDMRVKSITERFADYLKCFLTNRKYFSVFSLDEDTLALYYNTLMKFKPLFLRGYAFPVFLLAQYQRDVIKQRKLTLKGVSLTTEKINGKQRKTIEEEFNCPVFDQYGCGEILMIAGECAAHNGMHITEEHVIVEQNNNNEFIITDLDNYAMPFLRYKNGDLGVIEKETCQCGLHHKRIKELTGRVDDTIILQTGKVINSSFFAVLFEYMTTVKAFQVNYFGLDKMEVNIVPDKTFNSEDTKYISEKIKMAFGPEQLFSIKNVAHIKQNPNGKTKYINVYKDKLEVNAL